MEDGELVYDPEPTPGQAAAVREAVDSCPTLAIEIAEE
jgi:ferredoxin